SQVSQPAKKERAPSTPERKKGREAFHASATETTPRRRARRPTRVGKGGSSANAGIGAQRTGRPRRARTRSAAATTSSMQTLQPEPQQDGQVWSGRSRSEATR